uniref:Chromosome 1 open reading frame 230 n=1 Tax=Astyanax mexicanus TaxID=7994 RepID=A0A3B1IY04_ASTMX
MNPLFKEYKSKVMKTLNPDAEEEPVEEVCEVAEEMTTVQSDERPSSVTQLAKRMQGVGAKGWKNMTALFNKDDEHQLLEAETDNQPVADHPLAVRPEEPPRPKRGTGFWDNFATKWQQAAAMKQAEAAAASGMEAGGEAGVEPEADGRSYEDGSQAGMENEAEGGGRGNSFSKYASLGGANDEASSFKWNFVTSKLAELKSKSMTKTN